MEKKAKEIAGAMHARGLQPWHVEGELEVRAIPLIYRERLKKIVVKQLKTMQNY